MIWEKYAINILCFDLLPGMYFYQWQIAKKNSPLKQHGVIKTGEHKPHLTRPALSQVSPKVYFTMLCALTKGCHHCLNEVIMLIIKKQTKKTGNDNLYLNSCPKSETHTPRYDIKYFSSVLWVSMRCLRLCRISLIFFPLTSGLI